jgi:hypothetical protein
MSMTFNGSDCCNGVEEDNRRMKRRSRNSAPVQKSVPLVILITSAEDGFSLARSYLLDAMYTRVYNEAPGRSESCRSLSGEYASLDFMTFATTLCLHRIVAGAVGRKHTRRPIFGAL